MTASSGHSDPSHESKAASVARRLGFACFVRSPGGSGPTDANQRPYGGFNERGARGGNSSRPCSRASSRQGTPRSGDMPNTNAFSRGGGSAGSISGRGGDSNGPVVRLCERIMAFVHGTPFSSSVWFIFENSRAYCSTGKPVKRLRKRSGPECPVCGSKQKGCLLITCSHRIWISQMTEKELARQIHSSMPSDNWTLTRRICLCDLDEDKATWKEALHLSHLPPRCPFNPADGTS